MAIQSVSSNNVSFGKMKTTKKGNEYQKTHVGTVAGLSVGLLSSGALGFGLKKVNNEPSEKRKAGELIARARNILMDRRGLSKPKATMCAKASWKLLHLSGIVMPALFMLGVGALVNKAINHHRAKSADKVAEAAAQVK